MLINYFRTTLRIIRKTPMFSLLNIAGLALGVACAALIFLWVEDEFEFDRQAAKRNELYSIRMNIDYSGKIESYTSVPGPMPDAIRGIIPGIANNSRLGVGRELFALNDKATYEYGFYVDTSYFSMTQLSFVKGNASGFSNPHTLVLTERMAKKFFGGADALGRTLRVNNQEDYTIIGVVKDPPENVSLRFEWLAPVENFLAKNTWLNYWGTYGISTLVELKPNADLNMVNRQLTAILRPKDHQYANAECMLWSMKDWHLYENYTNGRQNGGQITYVKVFSTVAFIILLIACINFMNLATARAGQRAREIGVRKTLGAARQALISQFITEALVMSFIAVLLAVLLVYIFLPGFNLLTDKSLSFDLFTPRHLIGLIAIGAFCGLIAGSYPAFYLSSFQPVAVLKGQRVEHNGSAGLLRKALVVTQFSASVILIICTIIVYQQVRHIKGRDLGFDKSHLLYSDLQGNLVTHFTAVRNALQQTGVVQDAALSNSPPLAMYSTVASDRLTWDGRDVNNKLRIHWESVSPEYLSTMGLQLKSGRNFNPDIASDFGTALINESLAAIMGKAGRLGEFLTYRQNMRFQIVGIVKDYLFNDMYGSVTPLMLTCDPETANNYSFLSIRLKPGTDLTSSLAKVEGVLKTENPGYPFVYQFADETFDQLFRMESRIGKLAEVFAVLAIVISCLGLFGLAAYTTERRKKEIGIRKVLGASTSGLAGLLSGEFLQLVTISCLIAFPLAWLTMNRWLIDYPYRTPIYWWVFGAAGVAAILIALLTVSIQSVRAARSNPVKTLRSE